jgi:cysteinyl-tRNA synthetase
MAMDSLISQLTELKSACERMTQNAQDQQHICFTLIDGIVKLHQQHRVLKNYSVSDSLRDLLDAVGVKIQQGTDGYEYGNIPHVLRGRAVQDTWSIDK